MNNSANYSVGGGVDPDVAPCVSAADDEDEIQSAVIPATHAGDRLDRALAVLFPGYSRSRLQSWLESGRIVVDGERAEAKRKVRGGEVVLLEPQPDPREVAFVAEPVPLTIVDEDDALIVIDKPAGLVVHPGSGNWSGTMLNGLLAHSPQLAGVPRAGIVHRLDKDTSGLLVVAKTIVAQTDLVRQLQARTVRREYVALVAGHVTRDGMVDAPIGRHPRERTMMAIVAGAKPAITHYAVIRRYPDATLLRCRLETGRTHQIRVHMASIGHPLVGDPVYRSKAGVAAGVRFGRQALHAERLGLRHPVTGDDRSWVAPVPDDLARLLDGLDAATSTSSTPPAPSTQSASSPRSPPSSR